MTFGQIVVDARKKIKLSQKELAARVKKEDGQPISAQYLNDIEYDRRGPPTDHIIEELARALNLAPDFLYLRAGKLPPDLRGLEVNSAQAVTLFETLRGLLKETNQEIP
jgi:transcriptional regulator with XRE-family HTH domain